MKSDRELLELAAKAIGIPFEGYHELVEDPESSWYGKSGLEILGGLWNPLKDDGNALRLAVKLGMEVYVDNHPDGCECTEAQSHTYQGAGRAVYSFTEAMDQYEATRRAIVRIAADIGANMP